MATDNRDDLLFHYVSPLWSDVARIAYRMTCVSPLALLMIALCFPYFPTYDNPHIRPGAVALALCRLLCLFAPVGAALGAAALVRIRQSVPGRAGGRYAIAAICLGSFASVALWGSTEMLDSQRMNAHKRPSDMSNCMSNEKQISLAFLMYAQDYDGYFPPGKTWNDGTYPYIKNSKVYHCPAEENDALPSYAFNGSLARRDSEKVPAPERTVLNFDSIPGKNLSGWSELLPSPPRHPVGFITSFVDGHVKYKTTAGTQDVIWHLPAIRKPVKPTIGTNPN